jgi:uncharacterized iron-regulated membrane protein
VPADSLAARPSLTVLSEIALRASNGGAVAAVIFPTQPDGIVRGVIRTPGEGSRDTVHVAIDRYSGAVLDVRAADQPLRLDFDLAENVHLARVGGPAVRALSMLSCLAGAVLLPTGVIVWWIKRSRKAGAAQRRQGREPVGAEFESTD